MAEINYFELFGVEPPAAGAEGGKGPETTDPAQGQGRTPGGEAPASGQEAPADTEETPGVEAVIPDYAYLKQNASKEPQVSSGEGASPHSRVTEVMMQIYSSRIEANVPQPHRGWRI